MPHSLVSPNSYKKRKEKHIERHETRLEGECLYRLYYDCTMYKTNILIKVSCTKYIIYPILQGKLDINSKYICLIDRKKILCLFHCKKLNQYNDKHVQSSWFPKLLFYKYVRVWNNRKVVWNYDVKSWLNVKHY